MRISFPDIDECAVSFPWQDNGTFINNNGSYVCDCKEGYMGKQCGDGNSIIILLLHYDYHHHTFSG